MSSHPLKLASVLLLSAGAIAAGLGVTSGQEPKDREKPAPAAGRKDDDPRFEAIERRLRDLELKLESLANRRNFAIKPGYDAATAAMIRPRFENAMVEKVFVSEGSRVKKGEPLLVLRNAELATAKIDVRTKYVQWDHDLKYLKAREPLSKEGRITQMVWVDTVNDEKKSRLDYLVARDRLLAFGLAGEQIDQLLEGLGDDRQKAQEVNINTQDLARLIVVSPIDGIVIHRDVFVGNFYDQNEILLVVAVPKP